MARDRINLMIHEDDPILIEVMGIKDAATFTPVEEPLGKGYPPGRKFYLGNITVRIYEP